MLCIIFLLFLSGGSELKNRWISFAAVTALIIIVLHLLFMYRIGQTGIPFNSTYRLQQIQRNIFWVIAISYTLVLLFAAAVIISINMDRRRYAESSLADNLKILEATVNATGDGILVVDINRKILKANDLFFKIWNIPPDMCGLSDAREFLSFIRKQLKDSDVYEAWENSLYETCAIEHYIASLHDGRIIDVFSNPLMDKGSLVGRVWSFRDITKQVNVEHELKKSYEEVKLITEALEYDKVKTEFFANISHEVKTPLNIIIGTLQLIELGLSNDNITADSDKMAKYTAIMRQNCYRLLRTLNNLIYITEIDSGYIEMRLHNTDLAAIVKNITASVEKFLQSKEIQLELNIEPDSLKIACDTDKIERILLNLISNSVKFSENGGKINISLYEKDKWAYISIKDNGIGIPEEMKDLIFQRFRQVDKSFTRKREGSGIGLSLVKSLVEMHEGTIEVKSEYGKGSEFIVKLPVRLAEDDEIAAAAEETSCVFVDRVNIEFSDIY